VPPASQQPVPGLSVDRSLSCPRPACLRTPAPDCPRFVMPLLHFLLRSRPSAGLNKPPVAAEPCLPAMLSDGSTDTRGATISSNPLLYEQPRSKCCFTMAGQAHLPPIHPLFPIVRWDSGRERLAVLLRIAFLPSGSCSLITGPALMLVVASSHRALSAPNCSPSVLAR
jgi:hypothetical protein